MNDTNDSVETWMKPHAKTARAYIEGNLDLGAAFRWYPTKQGGLYWSQFCLEKTTFPELSEEDQAYIRLIASADEVTIPEESL